MIQKLFQNVIHVILCHVFFLLSESDNKPDYILTIGAQLYFGNMAALEGFHGHITVVASFRAENHHRILRIDHAGHL